jgi:outer membrane protein TolC
MRADDGGRSISFSLTLTLGVTLLVLLGFVPEGRAQPRPVGLREAVALAVRQNPVLASAAVDVRIAQAAVESARGLDDVLVEGGVNGRETRSEPEPGTTHPIAEGSSNLRLTKPLPTGGLIGLQLQTDYARTSTASTLTSISGVPTTTITAEYATSLQLHFSHPLLRGLGVDVARADRRRGRAQVDLATAQRQAVASALVRDVVFAYWDLAYATKELAIRRTAAAAARDQLRRVEANIGVGKQPRSASAEIEVAIALRDDAILSAEQALADRALALGRLCGLPLQPDRGPLLVASDEPTMTSRVLDARALLERALQSNSQLQALRARAHAAAVEIDVTENGLLPQLDFTAAGGPIGNAGDIAGASSELTTLKSYVITAGLAFQQPIGSHAARGARESARETVRKVQFDESDSAAQVTEGVAHGVRAVETSRRREVVLARSTEAAALDLEAEKARFDGGRSTNFDVLRRQDSLANAQLVHLRAMVDCLKALADVDAITGEILTLAVGYESAADEAPISGTTFPTGGHDQGGPGPTH